MQKINKTQVKKQDWKYNSSQDISFVVRNLL